MSSTNIYLFNPACEMEIANSNENYVVPQNISKLKSDLEMLQLFLASESDYLLLSKLHSTTFFEPWSKIGCAYPTTLPLDNAICDNAFLSLYKAEIRPWGWSPAMLKLVRPLLSNCCESFRASPVTDWNCDYKAIYSRKTALTLLTTLVTNEKLDWLISVDKMASVCTTHTEIEELLQKHDKIVLKSPWSSSGRGIQMLRNNRLNDANKQWINNILNQQDFIMAEPLLNKKIDFSTQWLLDSAGEFNFIGFNFFSTNSNGQYTGNHLGRSFPIWENCIREFFDISIQQQLTTILKKALDTSNIKYYYIGYLSVDAMIFEDANGKLKIQPCVEINLRQNMGLVAGRISRYIHPEKSGVWKIEFIRNKAEYDQLNQKIEANKPNFGDNKLVAGVLLTTPNASVGNVCSYVTIG